MSFDIFILLFTRQPLEIREDLPEKCYKSPCLGVWSPICPKKLQGVVKLASALESGRFVARDIGKFYFRSCKSIFFFIE